MSHDFAIDTNVAVYAFSKDDRSVEALRLIERSPKISVQLLNEFAAVSLRKRRVPWDEIKESLEIISNLAASLRSVNEDVHRGACDLAQRYKVGFYDALMLSAALLDRCSIFYSEDMQHGLVVDETLTITNPFMPAGKT